MQYLLVVAFRLCPRGHSYHLQMFVEILFCDPLLQQYQVCLATFIKKKKIQIVHQHLYIKTAYMNPEMYEPDSTGAPPP